MCGRGWSGKRRTVREKIYTFKKGEKERSRGERGERGREGGRETVLYPRSVCGNFKFYTRFITIIIIMLLAEWLILAMAPLILPVVMPLRIHTGQWRLWNCSNTRMSLLGWRLKVSNLRV